MSLVFILVDIEWQVIYVGSAEDQSLDQELDAVLLPASNTGRFKFVLQVPAPDASRIPPADILGVTIVLLTCSYRTHEFIRVGYYVNNEHPDHKPAQENAQDADEGEGAELTIADDGDAGDDDDDDDDDNMDVDNSNEASAAGSSSALPKLEKASAEPEKAPAEPVKTPAESGKASSETEKTPMDSMQAKAATPRNPATGPPAPALTKMPDLSQVTRVISSEPTVTRFTLKHWDEPSSGTIVDPELSGDVMQHAPSDVHVP